MVIIIIILIIISLLFYSEMKSGGHIGYQVSREELHCIFIKHDIKDAVFAYMYEELDYVDLNSYDNQDNIALLADLTGIYKPIVGKSIGFQSKVHKKEDLFKKYFTDVENQVKDDKKNLMLISINDARENFTNSVNKIRKQYDKITEVSGVIYIPDLMFDFNLMLKNLTKFAETHESITLLKRDWSDYMTTDGLSNHYSGIERMKARKKNAISPIESWKVNKELIINTAAYEENIYEAFATHSKICNTFNPTIMINCAKSYFIDLHKIKILDPSLGWSDRCIASIAMGCQEFVAFDPNFELKPGFDKLVKDHAKGNYKFIPEPFLLKAKYENYFDFVFSSSPFYDVEIYNNGKQSISETNSYEEWINKFYRQYLTDAYRCAAPGGLIAFYIEDLGGLTMGTDTCKIMNGLGADYYKDFGFIQTETRPCGIKKEGKERKLWCWTKPLS